MTANGDALAAGRTAFERHDWDEAYDALHKVDADGALTGADLERLAEAARWSRRYPELLEAFERAVRGPGFPAPGLPGLRGSGATAR